MEVLLRDRPDDGHRGVQSTDGRSPCPGAWKTRDGLERSTHDQLWLRLIDVGGRARIAFVRHARRADARSTRLFLRMERRYFRSGSGAGRRRSYRVSKGCAGHRADRRRACGCVSWRSPPSTRWRRAGRVSEPGAPRFWRLLIGCSELRARRGPRSCSRQDCTNSLSPPSRPFVSFVDKSHPLHSFA